MNKRTDIFAPKNHFHPLGGTIKHIENAGIKVTLHITLSFKNLLNETIGNHKLILRFRPSGFNHITECLEILSLSRMTDKMLLKCVQSLNICYLPQQSESYPQYFLLTNKRSSNPASDTIEHIILI